MMDRLLYHADTVVNEGESYQMKERRYNRKNEAGRGQPGKESLAAIILLEIAAFYNRCFYTSWGCR